MRRKLGFLRDSEGSALVEFAIILGLIILSGAAAVLVLGAESQRTFALLSKWRLFESSPTSAAPRDRENYAETDEWPAIKIDQARRQITVDQETLTIIFSGLALLGYLASRRRRMEDRQTLEQMEEDRELVERVDNKRFLKRQEIFKVLSADPSALLENRTEVRHLMTTQLHTVRPKTTIDEMKAIMALEQVRHFPVVTEKGTLVGIVSDGELIGHSARVAADVMTRTLITVSPTTKISSALSQMINRNISCLPVMEGTTLVGMLTTTDAVMTLQCALQIWQRRGKSTAAARKPVVA